MVKYVLLGATGATGSACLQFLLENPPKDFQLNLLVRSRARLDERFPALDQLASFSTTVHIGSTEDNSKLSECCLGADVIIVCVGVKYAGPGTTLMQDTASSIILALEQCKKTRQQSYRAPTICYLRSASLNKSLSSQQPAIFHAFLYWALEGAYSDIQKGCDKLLAASPDLLQLIIVDPPSLHGAYTTDRTGYELIATEAQRASLSYPDLGAAMCELADRRAEFAGRAVGVSATGKVDTSWPTLLGYMFSSVQMKITG